MEEEAEFLHEADANEEDEENEELDNYDEDEEVLYSDYEKDDLTSPLTAAAKAGDLATVQICLEQGADKNEITNKGRTAMYYAAKTGHLKIVRLLLEHSADKEKSDNEGKTPLWIACRFGHLLVAQLLVEQGADVDKADRYGRNPLITASYNGDFKLVRYLLEQGADRDKAINEGFTSLHFAAQNGHCEIAKLLMVYGADLNARNKEGDMPIDMRYLNTEEIQQAIRDEPRRRIDEAPGKRATEQDRHPNATTSASAQEEDEKEVKEPSIKKPHLDDGIIAADMGKVAEEDEDSEPSDGEDD